jgi:hypothetical protein
METREEENNGYLCRIVTLACLSHKTAEHLSYYVLLGPKSVGLGNVRGDGNKSWGKRRIADADALAPESGANIIIEYYLRSTLIIIIIIAVIGPDTRKIIPRLVPFV